MINVLDSWFVRKLCYGRRVTIAVLAILLLYSGLLAAQNNNASLRGVYNAGSGVVWVSGSKATILRSVDNGASWHPCSVPQEASKLDFRGIWAAGKNHAIVLSSGPGEASRLYETEDGCLSWQLLLTNSEPTGFWDAFTLQGATGVLLGDPVNNRFTVYRSLDAGHHWVQDQSKELASEPQGEGAFAASNSSLVIRPDKKIVLFATGGVGGPRILWSNLTKSGKWTSVRLPFNKHSESAGIFSLAFRNAMHGVAVGGDYKNPADRDSTAAFTTDGGKTWQAAVVPPGGYRSSVGWDGQQQAWIAVGPGGSDLSKDDGRTWQPFGTTGWNALSLPWAVGSQGHIDRLLIHPQ